MTPQPDQAQQGLQDHFEILAQGPQRGEPSLVVFHYGTVERSHTRSVPVSTGSPVTCQEIITQAGGSGMCQAPGMHCSCFLEGVAPFNEDNVVLHGWQRIDVRAVGIDRVCDPTGPEQGAHVEFEFDDDVVTLFDLGQRDTAGSSWADARQVLFDRWRS